ncbi:MAG: FHA domain-containing protein [Anaerolineae bacterium]|nr:FHA domain-containing protein [Anaerolineae bacterium]
MQAPNARFELIMEAGPRSGTVYPLLEPIVTLGRGVDNTIVLESPRVSRHHARLRISRGGAVVLEDLGSTNGTFIDGFILSEPRRIQPGEAFSLAGNICFRLGETGHSDELLPWGVRQTIAGTPAYAGVPAESFGAATSVSDEIDQTWIAPPDAAPLSGDEVPVAYAPRGLIILIGLLLLLICLALAFSVYLWFAPNSFWERVFELFNLPFPA